MFGSKVAKGYLWPCQCVFCCRCERITKMIEGRVQIGSGGSFSGGRGERLKMSHCFVVLQVQSAHILQEGGGFSQAISCHLLQALGAPSAASGADGAFCVGIPSLKHQGGSTEKSKDKNHGGDSSL